MLGGDAAGARMPSTGTFAAVYMTGYRASDSLLARPDIGLLSFAEMADQRVASGKLSALR